MTCWEAGAAQHHAGHSYTEPSVVGKQAMLLCTREGVVSAPCIVWEGAQGTWSYSQLMLCSTHTPRKGFSLEV